MEEKLRDMEKKLFEAAARGSVEALREVLEADDGLILDRITLNCYKETPLHIAAMRGHIDFVKELLFHNISLAAEVDFRKMSALHVASAKGHLEIVKELLSARSDISFWRDRDGRNPLHLAAMKGRVEVLRQLLRSQMLAAREKMDHGQTVLHLAVKHDQLEAIKVVAEAFKSDHELVNAKDDDGNTILHLAVLDKQIETIRYLLNYTRVDYNATNAYGCTALDMLAQSPRDIKDLDIGDALREAGCTRSAKNTSLAAAKSQSQPKAANKVHSHGGQFDSSGDWLSRRRDSIMVVASLIATIAFQAGMNPPGGVWQDNEPVDSQGNAVANPHKAGESVMAFNHPRSYRYFLRANTIAFVTSLSIILLLISGLPFRRKLVMWALMVIMWLTITTTALTYGVSIYVVTPRKDRQHLSRVIEIGVSAWCCVMALLLLGNTLRLANRWLMKRGIRVWPGPRRLRNATSINVGNC